MTRETQRFMEVSALYLRDCRITASKTTIDNRSRTLSMFLKSLDENGDDPDVLGVMNWKSGMAERGLKRSSMRQYLSELHEFFRWAVEHGFYESNPVKRSDIPKSRQQPYHLMSEDQMLRLLEHRRPSHGVEKTWLRNRAIVVMFITTSVRNSELLDLVESDLDWENHQIYIRSGKGDKDRFVPFPKIAQAAIREYLAAGYRPKEVGPDAALFGYVDEKSGRWKPFASRIIVSKIVNSYVHGMIPEYEANVRSHALRHIGASLLLTNGESMEQIQQTLGHSDMRTTKIYAARLRPDKTHVETANRIWEEIAYQTRLSEKEAERLQEKMPQDATVSGLSAPAGADSEIQEGREPALRNQRQPPPEKVRHTFDGTRNLFGDTLM